jgi:hypothetical protein
MEPFDTYAAQVGDIVNVDDHNRGHRPDGKFLSHYEMAQIADHRDQIRSGQSTLNQQSVQPERLSRAEQIGKQVGWRAVAAEAYGRGAGVTLPISEHGTRPEETYQVQAVDTTVESPIYSQLLKEVPIPELGSTTERVEDEHEQDVETSLDTLISSQRLEESVPSLDSDETSLLLPLS